MFRILSLVLVLSSGVAYGGEVPPSHPIRPPKQSVGAADPHLQADSPPVLVMFDSANLRVTGNRPVPASTETASDAAPIDAKQLSTGYPKPGGWSTIASTLGLALFAFIRRLN